MVKRRCLFIKSARSTPYFSLLRQNFVMPRLCYGSAEQVNLLCSRLNRKVQFSLHNPASFSLFIPKNLHLLKFFVLLHQLEKSELKNAEGR